ncbi:MAG: hypothetical protein AAF235_04630, partial [Planctomycetota bacterium]
MTAALRWILPALALVALGPLAALPVAALRGGDGSSAATPLTAASPALGLASLAIIAFLAAATLSVAVRVVDRKTAMAVAAYVIIWPAVRTGDTAAVLALTGSAGVFGLLAEGIAAAAIGVLLLALVSMARGESLPRQAKMIFTNTAGLASLAIGVAAAFVVATFVAFSTFPLQLLMAGMLGAAIAGAA